MESDTRDWCVIQWVPMSIQVTVFSDYICPFCYIGSHRLLGLADEFDLDILWANIEIHPDNPPEGRPVEELGYSPDQWRRMMGAFEQMAGDEGLPIVERTFTTNSRRALLLAEAAKEAGQDVFARVHERLFRAYFGERRNIGDPDVLITLAEECGMSEAQTGAAWTGTRYAERLRDHHEAASRLGVTGTPTCVIASRQVLVGAVDTDDLRRALAEAAG